MSIWENRNPVRGHSGRPWCGRWLSTDPVGSTEWEREPSMVFLRQGFRPVYPNRKHRVVSPRKNYAQIALGMQQAWPHLRTSLIRLIVIGCVAMDECNTETKRWWGWCWLWQILVVYNLSFVVASVCTCVCHTKTKRHTLMQKRHAKCAWSRKFYITVPSNA